MQHKGCIAGIVMAGGRSRRMQRDKALLHFRGKPLVEHMQNILRETGVDEIIVSGQVDGYDCCPDEERYEGPARAMQGIVQRYTGFNSFLFVPVDMPLLDAELLQLLMKEPNCGYFIDCPLPVFVRRSAVVSDATSVQHLLDDWSVSSLPLPEDMAIRMKNVNTPQDWEELKKS